MDLKCQMNSAATCISRRIWVRYSRFGAHQRLRLGLGRNAKFVSQALLERRIMPLRGAAIAGKQQAADQIPAIDLAVRVEPGEPAGECRCRQVLARCILVLQEALKRMHKPASQGFAAIERPIFKLLAIGERETGQKIAAIKPARLLEIFPAAGALEQV